MNTASEHFPKAVSDYLYLQERNYPQKTSIKLVGDRYQLSGIERSMLYRGVVTSGQKRLRQNKKLDQLPDKPVLHIDGYNVIRTIGSYLLGKVVYISMDGFIRDASEMHRSTLKKQVLDRSLLLLMDFLKDVKPVGITIYFDEPVSKSGELVSGINILLRKNRLNGKAITAQSPDYYLKQTDSGIVCTADSAIIDHCKTRVFDLPGEILNLNFQTHFINIDQFVH
jgi:hypothetical protein